MTEQHMFIFPMASIKQLVEQRTSFLVKMRGGEAEPHLLDRLSLTEGESFLSNEYLEEAAAETYDWIKAFGRNVSDAYHVYPDGELHTIKENHGAHIRIGSQRCGLVCKQELSINDWSVVNNVAQSNAQSNSETKTVHINLPNSVDVMVGDAAEVHYSIIINYTIGVIGAPIEDSMQQTLNYCISSNDLDVNSCQFVVRMSTELGAMGVKRVDSVVVKITQVTPEHFTLKKGDYILVQDEDGTQNYGLVGANYDSNNGGPILATPLGGDVRNAIVMKVELPDWMDRNMLPSIERNLKEALANFVIWRWLEIVFPQEAESFYSRWEEKARQAQLGLNTENHTLQRKSTWL